MKNNWSKSEKITDNIYSVVKACSALTIQGIANGRTIPVLYIENDEENKIANTIEFHKTAKQGACSTQWGITDDYKYALLFLKFSLPTEVPIVLFFDILKFGHVVTHIIRMQCLYLAIGDENSKLSENMDSHKILIEVKNNDITSMIDLLMIAKYFERIGDHAENIAEWVIYSITGKHVYEYEIK